MTFPFQDPSDHELAEWLRKVGKNADCTCEIEIQDDFGGRERRGLARDILCPVHFPETRAQLKEQS